MVLNNTGFPLYRFIKPTPKSKQKQRPKRTSAANIKKKKWVLISYIEV